MPEPFLSELKLVSFSYAPRGWAQCNGQLLPINQNQALFSLLGTTYGGNGQTTFALPDLRGKVAIHFDSAHNLGETAGSTAVTVNVQQMPQHLHVLNGTSDDGDPNGADGTNPANRIFAKAVNGLYGAPSNLKAMALDSVTSVGGSQPHNNMQPYTVLNWIIALQGIFPSRN